MWSKQRIFASQIKFTSSSTVIPIKKRFFYFPHPLNCAISGNNAFGPVKTGFNNLVEMDDLGRTTVEWKIGSLLLIRLHVLGIHAYLFIQQMLLELILCGRNSACKGEQIR